MSPFRRRHAKQRRSNTPLMWLMIISLVAIILAAVLGLGGGAIDFIEQYFSYRDDSYRPMDTERQTTDILQERPKSINQSGP
jgi:hypothetical protein